MIGSYLRSMIATNKLKIPEGSSVGDIEAMYSLLLSARGKTIGTVSEDDEYLVLTFLCRIIWPGKRPDYVHGIFAYLSHFAGIANDPRKQASFYWRISKGRLSRWSVDRSHGTVFMFNGKPVNEIPALSGVFKTRRPKVQAIPAALKDWLELKA